MKLNLLLLLTFFIATSCMPEQAMRTPVSVEADTSTSDTDDEQEEPQQEDILQLAQWYDSGFFTKVLTIAEDNSKSAYLYGDDISLYLNNATAYQADYCLLINFQSTLDKNPKEYRVRLFPQNNYNPQTQKTTRYYRVNLGTSTGNEVCNKVSFESNSTNVTTFNTSDISNSVDQICTNCLNIISSTSIKLYQVQPNSSVGPDNITYNSGYLSQVSVEDIAYDKLTLRVDMNNNTQNNSPSCTNADCQAQGFNCCLQDQCVMDAGLKNSRQEIVLMSQELNDGGQIINEFDYAQAQMINNPLTYLQYPQFYYICLENVPTDGGSGSLDPTDPAGDAEERLNSMIHDFYCIEELKENSVSDPFHTDPVNGSATYQICETNSSQSSDTLYYQEVMKRLYQHCGCAYETYNEIVSNCPKYTYKAVYNTSTNEYELSMILDYLNNQSLSSIENIVDIADITDIARIECVSPEVDPNILPFQDMNVIVNSKTAPHRFFDENTDSNDMSIEITDVSDLHDDANGVQEGATFQYLDNEKNFPLNGSYNMNSILGQMTLDLTQAKPAKMIELEFDKMYYVATLEGFYTPCPSCAKDSWFPNFTPNPLTTQGVGLQSTGYTTRRDAWGSNTTFGNYEDTIFGRACWLPPTMIPFSHSENSDQQTQRLNRLKTQAAFYTNGYQRDWFGFNKGALIGSFDGVSWFAVGKGRVVRATSDRLYLAINAPFADLAQYNDHIVSVQEWDFLTTGAEYDYHPNESINGAFQNEAGLCQRHHRCETDSDCITQLGWEYSCVDVNQYTTKWPQFEVEDAVEVAGASREGTIISLLNQGQLPSGTSSKKCVYRGAGAPCRVDYDEISDSEKRKALACAPNFYCASLNHGGVFNKEVARYAGVLEDLSASKNHYFGQDANHLGRPKDYMSTGNLFSLPSDSQTAIDESLTTIDGSGTGDFGLCRPGKSLPEYASTTGTSNADFNEQQKSADSGFRTDFISQISGCNSALYTNLKYSSCPMLDREGNYIHHQQDYLDDQMTLESLSGTWNKLNVAAILGKAQNSCGMQALDQNAIYGYGISANAIYDNSAFKEIEAKPLSSNDIQYEPTLTRDACFRKAGAVCHTDLDCSPNYKHADLIDILNPDFFGNAAEKKYWQESLICGQGNKEPKVPGTVDFNTYDITNNRCCREIGKDITMYTEDSHSVEESFGLETDRFSDFYPSDPNRYSRYSNLDTNIIDEFSRTPAYGFTRPSANSDHNNAGDLTHLVNILDGYQWKTINGAGKRTCCGGGWIRKFADGTNNWSINRLNLDVTNFKCLNFNTPLVNTQNPEAFGVTNVANNQDSQNLCTDAGLASAGCAQQLFKDLDYTPVKPIIDTTEVAMVLNTDPTEMLNDWADNLWAYLRMFPFDDGPSAQDNSIFLDWGSENPNIDPTGGALRRNLTFRLPSFITWPNNDPANTPFTSADLVIELERPTDTANQYETCIDISSTVSSFDCSADNNAWHGLCSASDPSLSTSAWQTACSNDGGPADDNTKCCYMYNPATRVLKVAFNYETTMNTNNEYAPNNANDNYNLRALGAKLTYTAPGTLRWEQDRITQAVTDTISDDGFGNEIINHRRSALAGNAYYYLRKLEKLELLGVPQIAYEPLYCHDNYQKIVPGLFVESFDGFDLKNIVDFISHPDTFKANDYPLNILAKPYQSDSASGIHDADNLNEPFLATDKLVDHEPIFSDHDFKCCTPLGTVVDAADLQNCCSGYAEGSQNSDKVTCKMAPGTDVNVYLNKFISSEGMSSLIDDPLTEDDFNPETGYPEFTSNVVSKVIGIANEFCAGDDDTRYSRGGAFGPFVAEPNGSLGKQGGADANRLYSLVDSQYDYGSNNDRAAGFDVFNAGLRWNHHIYCNPQTSE